jgi:hypothetical protein
VQAVQAQQATSDRITFVAQLIILGERRARQRVVGHEAHAVRHEHDADVVIDEVVVVVHHHVVDAGEHGGKTPRIGIVGVIHHARLGRASRMRGGKQQAGDEQQRGHAQRAERKSGKNAACDRAHDPLRLFRFVEQGPDAGDFNPRPRSRAHRGWKPLVCFPWQA